MFSKTETVWFITGTSRGIGLEITKQLLESSDAIVLVASRSTSEVSVLKDLATFAGNQLHVPRLDVNEPRSIKVAEREASEIVEDKGIDYLINNDGITIVNVSSTLGSIDTDFGQITTSYSVAKAALNMGPMDAYTVTAHTVKQAKEGPDITVGAMCPRHLQTDLGGPGAKLPVSLGFSGVLKVVRFLTPEDSGEFFDFEDERVQW